MWIRLKLHGPIPEVLVDTTSIVLVTPIIKGGCRVFLDPNKHEVNEFDTVATMDQVEELLNF